MMDRREDPGRFEEAVDIREIDECHYLAANLFEERQFHGWAQQELADRSGLTQPQIAEIEAGHANPTVRTLSKLSVALGKNIGQFFFPTELQMRGRHELVGPVWIQTTESAVIEVRPPAGTDVVEAIEWPEVDKFETVTGRRSGKAPGEQVGRLVHPAA